MAYRLSLDDILLHDPDIIGCVYYDTLADPRVLSDIIFEVRDSGTTAPAPLEKISQ
jgi:hypothetical protein